MAGEEENVNQENVDHQLLVDEGWENFLPFIEGVRGAVTARTIEVKLSAERIESCAVLAPRRRDEIQTIDVRLSTYNCHITLRLNRSDLYLIGYKEMSGRWIEFSNKEEKQLIENSTMLGYDGNYTALEQKANRSRTNTVYGRNELSNAVNVLAKGAKNEESRARQLIVIIGMTSEAVRFDKIARHLAALELADQKICRWMKILHNRWSPLCSQIFSAKNDENYQFIAVPLQTVGEPMTISTLEEALLAVRILLDKEPVVRGI